MADNFTFPDNTQDFQQRAEQLARRRKLAEQLVQQGMSGSGGGRMVGPVFTVGNQLGNLAQGLAGIYMGNKADSEANQLANEQQAAAQEIIKRLGTPGTKEQFGPAVNGGPMPQQPLSAEEEGARRLGVIGEGMGIPSLRQTLAAQLGQELDYPRQREMEAAKAASQQAALEAQDKRQAAQFTHQLDAIDRRLAGQKELRQMPTIHITNSGNGNPKAPSGYKWNDDGSLSPITGGPADKQPGAKPLTAKQLETQRGFMDLQSSLDNYDQMLNSYDFQGKTAVTPAQRAALEGAFTDVQMKLKTLYELGAPQAGDMRLLEQSLSNPTSVLGTIKGAAFGKEPHLAKTQQIRGLLDRSQANFEKQFGKDTPEAAKPPAAPARTRITTKAEYDALPAGTKWEMPDGRKGTK